MVIDDILDASRIITGKLRLDPTPLDLAAIVRDVVEVVRPAAQRKGIEIVLERFDEPAVLVGDPVRLQQVVWNLLSNAVKFTESGSVLIRLEQDDSATRLLIRDTGQGIDPDFLPHVFERFRQADASIRRKFDGLGLGLATALYLVELHGGEISAQSGGEGKGATFVVTLPNRETAPQPAPVDIPPP